MFYDVIYSSKSAPGIRLTTMLSDSSLAEAADQFQTRYPQLNLISVTAIPTDWHNDPDHTMLP